MHQIYFIRAALPLDPGLLAACAAHHHEATGNELAIFNNGLIQLK